MNWTKVRPCGRAAVVAGMPLAAMGMVLLASCAPRQTVRPTTSAAPRAIPPAELIRFDNPSRSAIVRHDLRARLDPSTNHLDVIDTLTVLHAPGVPISQGFPFLLWKPLAVESVEAAGAPAHFTSADPMVPRRFWKNPPYDELEGYQNAKEVQVFLDASSGKSGVGNGRGGSRAGSSGGGGAGPGAAGGSDQSGAGAPAGPSWPESIRLIVRYAGTVMDSLRPPAVAYDRSFEETAGLITPQGAYLAGSTFWVPTRPDEVFTFRCAAAVPAGWHAVCQGGMVASGARPGGADEVLDVWDCPHPMEEVYLVAGPWKLHQRSQDGVMVQTFTYAQTDSALYTRYLDGTARYLKLYGGLIGPYPFEKFALVENFWQTGFGMPSFTLLGDRVIRLPFILDTSYGHEILHDWWGNGVFVKEEEGNWCEGLTVYGADYLYKVKEGARAARDYRLNCLTAYLDYVNAGKEIPLSRFRGRHDFATQAIGYSKSMMVIHQLRRRVGEERFWEALRAFYRRNLWRRASWSDLLASFHDVAGIDPAPFLRQWIERTGAPRISVSGVACVPESGGFRVSATLEQTLPDGSQSGEPFDVNAPVRLDWADRDSTWDVPLSTWKTAWSVRVDRPPVRLEVDPDFDMLRRIDRDEIPPTLSRVLGSDSVTVVIAAGLSPDMAAAARALVADWFKNGSARVVDETNEPAGWIPATSAWYIGLGPAARRLIASRTDVEIRPEAGTLGKGAPLSGSDRGAASPGGQPGAEPGATDTGGGWRISDREFPGTSGVALTGTFPTRPDQAWAVIVAGDPAQLKAIGGKIPHYGKYSYLVFDGAKNIGEGIWNQTQSPLKVDLPPGR